MVRPLELPDDIESLKRLVLESIEAAEAARAALIIEQLKVEKLRFEIARFKRSRCFLRWSASTASIFDKATISGLASSSAP